MVGLAVAVAADNEGRPVSCSAEHCCLGHRRRGQSCLGLTCG